MKLRIGLLVCGIVLGAGSQVLAGEPPFWPCKPHAGAPYGYLVDSDELNQLISLAAANGLDLLPTLEKVYAGDKEALARVLRLSSRLTSRNMPMRMYGNMVYSIFLNFGESKGESTEPDVFIPVLLSQEPAVRQRIRDLLWYPVFCLPEAEREDAGRSQRALWPAVWPPDFVFGKDDRLFSKTPN